MFLEPLEHLCSASARPGNSGLQESAKQGAWARGWGRSAAGRNAGPPPAPAPPPRGPTARPQGHRSQGQAREEGFCGRARCPALCRWRPSKQQGFLLEVIPLPEGQAVELFHAHPKHFLEVLGRQVPLQTDGGPREEQLAAATLRNSVPAGQLRPHRRLSGGRAGVQDAGGSHFQVPDALRVPAVPTRQCT